MAMEARLGLKQTQKLVMTMMLQQAIKLLPLTRLELVQTIATELVENPLLEEVPEVEEEFNTEPSATTDAAEEQAVEEPAAPDPDWESFVRNADDDSGPSWREAGEQPSFESTLSRPASLSDHLLWQLGLSCQDEVDRTVGACLIGNLGDDGYLTTPLEEIAEITGASAEEVERILRLIQTFDPTGIAARSLRECLLLQADHLDLEDTVVHRLIEHYLDRLEEKQFPRICRELKINMDELLVAIRIIKNMDPKPGLRFNTDEAEYIVPDLTVVKMNDDYQVILNEEGVPRLRINRFYESLLRKGEKIQDGSKEYVENKFRSALWFIKSIEQRRQTLLKVGRSIVKFQREFLDKGTAFLRPLVLRDVANDIEMHESTVSRVITHKFIDTPQGIHELKYFFHSSVDSTDGDAISSVTVKEMIRRLVSAEDSRHPLTDQDIVEALEKQDVRIARRTVTKYRKETKIPSSNRRKHLFSV